MQQRLAAAIKMKLEWDLKTFFVSVEIIQEEYPSLETIKVSSLLIVIRKKSKPTVLLILIK